MVIAKVNSDGSLAEAQHIPVEPISFLIFHKMFLWAHTCPLYTYVSTSGVLRITSPCRLQVSWPRWTHLRPDEHSSRVSGGGVWSAVVLPGFWENFQEGSQQSAGWSIECAACAWERRHWAPAHIGWRACEAAGGKRGCSCGEWVQHLRQKWEGTLWSFIYWVSFLICDTESTLEEAEKEMKKVSGEVAAPSVKGQCSLL